MDTEKNPIGTLETVAICWGVAALAGAAMFGVMFVPFEWSLLQSAFGAGVIFLILGLILMMSFERKLPAPGEAPVPNHAPKVVDAPDRNLPDLSPRDVSAPSPHRDSVDWSDISETTGPDLNSTGVNKALPEGEAPFAPKPGLAEVPASPLTIVTPAGAAVKDAPSSAAASSGPAPAAPISAPSPHKDKVEPSSISDTRGPNLNDPRVNKARSAAAPAASAAVATPTAKAAPAPEPTAAPEPTPAPDPTPTPEPTAAAAPKPAQAKTEAPTPAPKTVPAQAEAATAPPSEDGTKPATLTAARDGKADDLKKIKGIGPKLEKLCNRLGFYHFDQIAAWTPDEVAWVDQNLEGFKGRVTRDEWVSQAKQLAAGGDTEFSKKVDKGGVY